jgi:hypothetical protein
MSSVFSTDSGGAFVIASQLVGSSAGESARAFAGANENPIVPRKMPTANLAILARIGRRDLARGLVDDVKFHFRNALIDHSYTFSGGRRDIDFAPTNERTAVIDTDDDRTAVSNVSDAQSRAKWQRWMSSGQFVGIEYFTARSLCILSVEAGKRVRCAFPSFRDPRVRREMPMRMSERYRLLQIGSL